MDKLFIEGRYTGSIDAGKIETGELPEKIGLFTTVQYLDFLEEIKRYLEKEGKSVYLFRLSHYEGQVLGCSIKKLEDIDGILYVGDGLFHPIALGIKNNVPVFVFNPMNEEFYQMPEERIEQLRKKQRAAYSCFISSKNVGLLVSLKPGQFNLNAAEKVKEKYPEKNYYTLAADTLDFNQLSNFNFIDCFVNTSCPRISYDEYEKFQTPIIEAEYLINDQPFT